MLSERKEKDFSPKFTLLSLAETPVDQLVAISRVHLLTQAKCKLKDSKILPDMPYLSPSICQSMR